MALTPQRQEELAALLADDGAALASRYPEVADYLRASATFARPADPALAAAEDAFDLRLLDYMTGGASENPYWDIVGPAVGPSARHAREVNGGSPTTTSSRLRYVQDLLQAAYAFAIPSPETLAWVVAATEGRAVVEIGAGRGYWAHQLSELGVDVDAYDHRPPGEPAANSWFPPVAGQPAVWHPVGSLRDLAAADRGARESRAEHVLFLCWPPAWGHPLAANALRAYTRRGGDRLIYVGEIEGDKCADPQFFEDLRDNWRLTDEDPNHVVWCTLHDVAQCWTRVS
jgi:hypothetical protein